MRKIFAGLALLGVLVVSSACGADTRTPSAGTANRISTDSSTASASQCNGFFNEFNALLADANDLDISTPSEARAFLQLVDTAVETGRTLMETCPSHASSSGFSSKIDRLEDAADSLRRVL